MGDTSFPMLRDDTTKLGEKKAANQRRRVHALCRRRRTQHFVTNVSRPLRGTS